MTQNSAHPHIPVMVEEFLNFFSTQQVKVFFDATLGAGGHAEALLRAHPEIETFIGCDQDPEALGIARERLKPWKDKVTYVQGNFEHLDSYVKRRGIKQVDGFFLTWGFLLCN